MMIVLSGVTSTIPWRPHLGQVGLNCTVACIAALLSSVRWKYRFGKVAPGNELCNFNVAVLKNDSIIVNLFIYCVTKIHIHLYCVHSLASLYINFQHFLVYISTFLVYIVHFTVH